MYTHIKLTYVSNGLKFFRTRMYGRLYMLVSVLILLAPVSLAVNYTYFKTVDLTYIPSAVKNGAGM